MTLPGGPVPEGTPQTTAPQHWPPQQEVPPPWSAQQPGPPTWLAPQQAAARWSPPAPPRRDSTRTIAIIALVLSGVTLLWMALSTIVPLLFFGLFAGLLGGGIGDVVDEGALTSSGTSYLGGRVTPVADGSVAGPTLAAAVVELVSDNGLDGMAGRVTCDAVPHVADDVSVLCRASDPTWFGIVRLSGSDGSFTVLTMGAAEDTMP